MFSVGMFVILDIGYPKSLRKNSYMQCNNGSSGSIGIDLGALAYECARYLDEGTCTEE